MNDMKKLLSALLMSMALVCASVNDAAAQGSTPLYIDETTFAPIQQDVLTGYTMDPIGKDRSNRPCARLKIAMERMSPEEINGLELIVPDGNVIIMKREVAAEGNGIIVELTARKARVYLKHVVIGSSNVVTLDLEGNKEYYIKGWSNQKKTVTVSSNRQGAEVYLDGARVGTISGPNNVCTIENVTIGDHNVRLRDGNDESSQTITVTNSNVYFNINVEAAKYQYVTFRIMPQDAAATVYFDGEFLPVDASGRASKRVVTGRHTYEITSAEYHPEKGVVDVDASNTKEVNIQLRPNFGYLRIPETQAAKGAVVYVDNKQIGTVPLEERLVSGVHNVSIVKQMYNTLTASVTITDGQTYVLNPSLNANFAELTLQVPGNAQIWVDGNFVGTGKYMGRFELGGHSIECRKEGHTSSYRTINVTPSMSLDIINLDAPAPIYGSMSVESNPMGAEIYVDGEFKGKTPTILNNIIVGNRKVEVRLNGYIPWEKTVNIKKDVPTDFYASEVTLRKEDRDVTVNISTDASASIYVDGEYVGHGRWTGIIKEGKHKFEAKKSNHNDGVLDYYLRYTGAPVNLTIPSPVVKTGSLEIKSTSGATISMNDGVSSYTYIAPYTNSRMPVGRYRASASKRGYHDSETKVFNVTEGRNTVVNLDLDKIGWSEQNSGYAPHNFEVSYGIGVNTSGYRTGSDNYLGLNYSYAENILGFHSSVMLGLENGDFGLTVGPLFHLNSYEDVDWQLYAGVGVRADYESRALDPLFSSYAWHWLVDAGIRINFDDWSDDAVGTDLSFASLSLGCKFSSDMFIPTVGLSLFPAMLCSEEQDWFASHFFGISMGYDTDEEEFMMGVYYEWCLYNLGLYANCMWGFDGGYSYAAGPVIRLTSDDYLMDWQLYGGLGIQNEEFMYDFGMRFGWESDSVVSFWDFSIGCQLYDGTAVPTLTLGCGISLTALAAIGAVIGAAAGSY